MQLKYGFVGLGIMGAPMASHLAKQVALTVYDARAERCAEVAGAQAAASVGELGEQCDVVLLSLPSSEVVKAVVAGEDGLLNTLKSGAAVIDLSTTDPSVSRELAEKLGERGVDFLDAPVSGGEKGAKDATLAIMVGGSETVLERHRETLMIMAGSVTHVGSVGSGGVAKLVNNMIVGAAFGSIAEGFALAVKNGLDPEKLYEAIRGGWAGSPVLDVCGPQIAARDYTPGGTVEILAKDLGYARNLARASEVPIPVTAVVDELFTAAKATGHAKESQSVLFSLWEPTMKARK